MLASIGIISSKKSDAATIAFVQSKSGKNNSVTFDTTPVAGNMVAVVVVQYGGSLPANTDISDNKGNSYLLSAQKQNTGEFPNVSVFHCINILSSATFTVSVALVPNYTRIFIIEYSGVTAIDQTNSDEQDVQSFANGGAINPTTNNQLIIMASSNDEPNTNTLSITPSGSFILREQANDGGSESTGFVMDYPINPIGSQTPQASLNHTLNSATVVVSFKS